MTNTSTNSYPFNPASKKGLNDLTKPSYAQGSGMNLIKSGFMNLGKDLLENDSSFITPKYMHQILTQGENTIKNGFHTASGQINDAYASRNMSGQPAEQQAQRDNANTEAQALANFDTDTTNELTAMADSHKKDAFNTWSNLFALGQQLARQDISANYNLIASNRAAEAQENAAKYSLGGSFAGAAAKLGSGILGMFS